MPNRVNWGLAASAWGKITRDAQGHDVYGAPVMFLGNRQVNFDPAGDLVKVFADGTVIYTGRQNSGYTGSLELTNLDDNFAAWALSESVDGNNVQYEEKEPTVNRFYLLWEWVQDAKNTRHIMYNITASRPSMSAMTNWRSSGYAPTFASNPSVETAPTAEAKAPRRKSRDRGLTFVASAKKPASQTALQMDVLKEPYVAALKNALPLAP